MKPLSINNSLTFKSLPETSRICASCFITSSHRKSRFYFFLNKCHKCSWTFSLCGLNWSCSSHRVTINLAYDLPALARRGEHDLWLSGWTRWIRSAWRVISANFLITSALSVSVAFIKSHNCIRLTCSFIHSGFFFGSLAVSAVPLLPVGVDKTWLKRPCAECMEHVLAHVYCPLWFVHYECTNWCTGAAPAYTKVLKNINVNKKTFLSCRLSFVCTCSHN